MKLSFWQRLYSGESLIYKISLAVLLSVFVIFCFPKGSKFQYEYQKGKLWQYETLYAPFEFAIQKSDQQLYRERQTIKDTSTIYYRKDISVYPSVMTRFQRQKETYFSEVPKDKLYKLVKKGEEFLQRVYERGVLVSTNDLSSSSINIIEGGNRIDEVRLNHLFFLNQLKPEIDSYFSTMPYASYRDQYYALFFEVMKPNVSVDKNFTQKVLQENLNAIVYTRGVVEKGQLIIAKGEVVEGKAKEMLDSLQKEYQSQLWNKSNYNWSLLGYCILVLMMIGAMVLYLFRYCYEAFEDNMKFTLILFNVAVMVWISSLVTQIYPDFMYLIPYAILPLTLKAFVNLRVSVFVYLITILLVGFIVPDSFHFVVIQLIAGFSTLINIMQVHHRVNLFLSAGYVTISYILTYTAFHLLTEGGFSGYHWQILFFFILNGFAILFVQPLIYIYERVFGLISDVSLLELSDTNSSLLKSLSEKAPGTFHHSLQVANLAEAAASEIRADAMLVRVGALYHDIGKLSNPSYFTENQRDIVNPHDELSPVQSAKIITDHVIEGISLARKNKIPDRIIDFIRTHHGTSLVYYFYKKQIDSGLPANESDFRYSGPLPFSKETAILMMADSVEAASKSLKNPTYSTINAFVEKIIEKQMQDGQFKNADITLKEIEKVKKIFKEKLSNIYHIRIEYPE